MPKGCVVIQGDPKRLLNKNLMKFNKGKSQFLHLRKNNPIHWCMLGYNQLESSFAERDWGIWWKPGLTGARMRPCCKEGKLCPMLLRQCITSRLREAIPPLIQCCWTHTWSTVFSSDLPNTRRSGTCWKDHEGERRIGLSFPWKKKRAGIVYPEEDLEGISSMYINTPRQGGKRMETVFSVVLWWQDQREWLLNNKQQI